MSSNNAADSLSLPSWSLAARLTAWYAGSSFMLILIVVAFLYWMLGRGLDQQDDNQITDQVRVLRDVLAARPGDLAAVRQEAEEEFQSRQNTQVYIRLLDSGGKVVVETPGMDKLVPKNLFPKPATESARGTNLQSANGRPFRIMAVPLGDGLPGVGEYIVQAGMDRSGEALLLANYRRNLWFVLAGGLFLCILVGYQIAYRGLRPLRLFAETANRINPNNLGERISTDRLPADLRNLSETFNRMLERLERSFTRLGQFSADIAHELRTPVNNLRGEVEVALGKPRTPDQYREILASNLEECGRLSRLIESLLFLAKAENPRLHITREMVDVGGELTKVREFYEAAAVDKGLNLVVEVEGTVSTHLNRALFQRAICNLVENAMAHTPKGGKVHLSALGNPGGATVSVADNGAGILPVHLPNIFDRFYRADQARSSFAQNVGLGLPIVKSIVDLHGGTIQVDSSEGSGTRVTLIFTTQMTKS